MEDSKIRQMKGALLQCAEENRNKPTPTFNINVSRLCEDAELRIRELEEENEKMRDCLKRWYEQKSEKFTETFYEKLMRDTEMYLWNEGVEG